MKIDIVCLLYEAENYIDDFLGRLKIQTKIEIKNAIFPITRSASAKADEMVAQKITEAGYTYFYIEPKDFSHSLTREKAIFEYCNRDIVVMLSQDVILEDNESVFRLASTISPKVVYAYGKQICKKKTIEHYIRKKNYGDHSEIVSAEDIERLQLKAFFASDAFSAYHRPTFVDINGYDNVHMMMSEDMYYSKKILEAGYKKAYVADAVVEHSHKFTIKQLYRRYYETGKWFSQHPEFDNYKTTDSGLKLALYVFKQGVKHFNVSVLFRFLPDMMVRYLGMKKGKKVK